MDKSIRIILFLSSILAITLPNFINGFGEVTGYNLIATMNISGIDHEKIEVSLVEDAIIVDFQKRSNCRTPEIIDDVTFRRRFVQKHYPQTCRRQFSLPAGIRPDTVQSNLTINGMLKVKASTSVRTIPPFGKIPTNIVSKEDTDID